MSRQETPEAWVKGEVKRSAGGEREYGSHDGGTGRGPSPSLPEHATCSLCGAWRGALGLEPTVEMFVAHTISWMREVKRVLRKDGVFWLDIDDSRGGSNVGRNDGDRCNVDGFRGSKAHYDAGRGRAPSRKGIKPKSLCLIPQRIALAAANDKEYIRFIKDERWAAWVAGIIDGEGYIGVQRTAAKGAVVHRPFMAVKMTDSPPIEQLRALTGVGMVYEEKPSGPNRRLVYVWRVQGEAAIQVIRDIYPWLVLKRRQARIAEALWDNKARKLEDEGRWAKLSEKDLAFREELYQMNKGCNQRLYDGDVALPDPPQNYIDHSWIVRSVCVIPTWMPESARDRPTDAYRTVLMLVKSPRYWYDGQAVRVAAARGWCGSTFTEGVTAATYPGISLLEREPEDGTRNLGNVWEMPPSSSALPGEHFASFSLEEPLRCIRASCPAEVCVKCGKARARMLKTKKVLPDDGSRAYLPDGPRRLAVHRDALRADGHRHDNPFQETHEEAGWTDCGCGAGFEPGIVLDPFVGTGTTAVAARMLGRRCIGIDVSERYVQQAIKRLTLGDKGMRRMAEAKRAGAEQAAML